MDEQMREIQQKINDLKLRRAGLVSLLEGIAEQIKQPNRTAEQLTNLLSQLEQAQQKQIEIRFLIEQCRKELDDYRENL